MKVLFISRTYPPSVGGMQKFASGFYDNYRKTGEIDLLVNRGGKQMIFFFFVKTAVFLVFHSKDYDIIHLYDAVLSSLTVIIKVFSGAKVSFTVNGLDIVYSRFGYQKYVTFFLGKADKVIAISHYTMEQCALRGIPKEKLCVIPVGLGLETVEIFSEEKKQEIMSRFDIILKGRKILLTVGRLVKRKGHAWFVEHVLKELPGYYCYLIAGDGPEEYSITDAARGFNLEDRVHLLGRVSDQEKNCLYQMADLFVMPNIHVENDQEGFGIVLLEAGSYGLPVIATNIEGIRDAVINQETGHLVGEKDATGFIDAILRPGIDRSSLAEKATPRFDWQNVIERYFQIFTEMKAGKG